MGSRRRKSEKRGKAKKRLGCEVKEGIGDFGL